ncbi:MAG: c-type cytochrome, partial [Opitutaceae bacterium]
PDLLAQADRARGRAVFQSVCAACHTLNGEGGSIGPDLTGSARDNLGYLLENILFPSALVPLESRLTTLTLKDGRVLAGMIRARSGKTLKLQTMTETMALAATDIVKEEIHPISLMPAGLFDALAATEARDLIAYLMSKEAPTP